MNNNQAKRKCKKGSSLLFNPQSSLEDPFEMDFLDLSVSRIKNKIKRKSIRTKKNRKQSVGTDTMTSIDSIRAQTSIRTLIQQRHDINDQSRSLENRWGYLSMKFKQKTKRKIFEQKKSKRLSAIISQNRSEKQFASKTIAQENQADSNKKLQMKSLVLKQRQKKILSLTKFRIEKSIAGEVGRHEEGAYHKQIEQMKEHYANAKKSSVLQGKILQQMRMKQKLKRQEEKKVIAEDNFKKKWMTHYLKKDIAERENRLKKKIYSKKIQDLLHQTEDLTNSQLKGPQS